MRYRSLIVIYKGFQKIKIAFLDKINIPKLKGINNYIIWSLYIIIALIKKGYNIIVFNIANNNNNKAFAIITLLYKDKPLLYIRGINIIKEA